jgi:thioesterase domain-containing protein
MSSAFFPPFFTGQHRFTPSQLGELIWVICHQNIRSFLQTIPAQRKRAVRFEDLVRSPKKTIEELAEFLGLAFDPKMIGPYDQDRRAQMTDAIHPMARMLGDVKFHQHKTISVAAAQRRQRRFAEKALGQVTRRLAGALGYNLRDRHHHTLVGLQTRGKRPAFFCVHPAGGTVSCYRHLARQLGPDQPLYAFRAVSVDGTAPHAQSIQELASFYLRELRDFQPSGPYQLGGWSFGGLVAFEMALKLAANGEQIALLALFSSHLFDSSVAHPPFRSRDFVLNFLRENQLEVGPVQATQSWWALLKHACEQAKRAGVVSPDLRLREFYRVMAQHARVYHGHIRTGRLYMPQGRVARLVLFDEEDRSMTRRGPFVDWNTVASQVLRHLVPGNHFTMLRKPNVCRLAKCLKEYLLPEAGESVGQNVVLDTRDARNHRIRRVPNELRQILEPIFIPEVLS